VPAPLSEGDSRADDGWTSTQLSTTEKATSRAFKPVLK